MKRFILLSAAVMMMTSCGEQVKLPEQETGQDPQKSGVRIVLSMDMAMSGLIGKSGSHHTTGAYGSGIDQVITLAPTRVAVQDNYPMTQENFRAVIKQEQTVLHSYERLSQIPPVLYLEPGSYSITLETNGTRNPINEMPLYQGQTPFTVEPGKVSAINAKASIQGMAISVSFEGLIANLTSYKMSYYHLSTPDKVLLVVTEQQNTPLAKRVYMDTPFPYGIKIEGRLKGVRWVKNILVWQDLEAGTYHNITVN